MVRVFRTLKDAIAEGWTVYDRWSGGYVVVQTLAGKKVIALVELAAPVALPKFDPKELTPIVTGADPEC